jgi:DnaK suppressor protein
MTATSQEAMSTSERLKAIVIPDDYTPHDNEPYMSLLHLAFFKKKLVDWRRELLRDSVETIHHMQEQTHNEADIADRASTETDRALELRTRDRERKLINKIDDALRRVEDGSYGYCEESGEPIGLTRLMARPVATLSIEAQERHERDERVYSDESYL